MGARKLRDWILHPLCELAPLNARQQMIGELLAEPFLARESARNAEVDPRHGAHRRAAHADRRQCARSRSCCAPASKQIPQLRSDLEALCAVAIGMQTRMPEHARRCAQEHPCRAARAAASRGSAGHARSSMNRRRSPAMAACFATATSPALDELRAAAREGKDWIAQLQQRAIDETGIKSLKVRYTSVFGYFIEVTKSNLAPVPAHWHRKQTVATGERFITPELKEVEGRKSSARMSGRRRWSSSFSRNCATRCCRISRRCRRLRRRWRRSMCSRALAETARLFGYCRPDADRRAAALHPRWPAPGARSVAGGGEVRPERRRCSMAKRIAC